MPCGAETFAEPCETERMQQLIEDAIRALAAAMPAGWTQVWMRVEMVSDGSGGTMAAYARTTAEPEVVSPVSLGPEHLLPWQALWMEMSSAGDAWTATTVVLTSHGRFDLRHDYTPLSDEPPMVRHARWAQAVFAR